MTLKWFIQRTVHFVDLAVGSPNAEMVYVFRSYPVVKVIANVIPLTKELKVTDSSFKFKVCWSLESKFELQNDTGKLRVSLHLSFS